jgi:hypothetical protein
MAAERNQNRREKRASLLGREHQMEKGIRNRLRCCGSFRSVATLRTGSTSVGRAGAARANLLKRLALSSRAVEM